MVDWLVWALVLLCETRLEHFVFDADEECGFVQLDPEGRDGGGTR
jgi:hypothetical protein